MSTSTVYITSLITLLVLILTVESIYHVYMYDDGHGHDEHCCLVRVRDKFCLATPITRSLIQVNKQCHRLNSVKRRRNGRARSSSKKSTDNYFDRISRRLNIKSTRQFNDKILLELRTPLPSAILKRDLVCLATTNNNLNLGKCYIETLDSLHHDVRDAQHANHQEQETRQQHELNLHDEHEHDDAINEANRLEVSQTIRIQEGTGLGFRQNYQLNFTNIHLKSRRERQCWSWYRHQTRKHNRAASKNQTYCINLNDHREQCINQFIYRTVHRTLANDHSEQDRRMYDVSLALGSKLFCLNNYGHHQLIGFHQVSTLCLHENHRITIERIFTDIANLSDADKNEKTLAYINNSKKLRAEFENDCLEQTSLVEIDEPMKPVPTSVKGNRLKMLA
jgi:hypothetical protein